MDRWCERRCLHALRQILAGWPLTGGPTDDWALLREALADVRAFAKDELTPEELVEVDRAIAGIDRLVVRRPSA